MKQNARSLFWIEPSAIAALLDQAVAEPPPAADAPVLSEPAIEVEESRQADEQSEGQPPAWPPLALPEDSLEARLAALFTWLKEVAGYERAFVADSEGLAMADDGAPAELVAAAAMLGTTWAAMQRSQNLPAGPSLAVDLADGERLHLLLAKSRWGRMNLGFVTRRPLPATALSRVGEAFQETVDETPTRRVEEKERDNP